MTLRTRKRAKSRTFQGEYRVGTVSVVKPVSQDVPFPATSLVRAPSTTFEESDVCADEVTVGFFSKRRSNSLLPINPCSITHRSVTGDGLNAYLRLGYDVVGSTGDYATKRRGTWELKDYYPEIPIPTIEFEFNRAQMIQSALASLRSELWDVGTFLAEFRKTADMVTKARQRFVQSINRVCDIVAKRNSRSKAKSLSELLDEFFSIWMEGRYGWRLLYYDLLDAQEAVHRLNGTLELVRKRYTLTSNQDGEIATPWTAVKSSGASNSPFDCRWSVSGTSVGRAGCIGHIDLTQSMSVDPIVTAWEVIPFTMVVDWFFNVGEALQAWSPFGVGKLDGAFFSQEDTLVASCELRVRPTFSFQGRPWTGCDTKVHSVSGNLFVVIRKKERVPSNPTFDLSFRPNISGLKIIDATALTWLLRRRLLAIARATRI